DDPDDLSRNGPAVRKNDVSSQGVFGSKILSRESLIDKHHTRMPCVVALCEASALQQWDSHGLKVSRADVPIIGRGSDVRSRLFLDDEGSSVHVVLTERHDFSQSSRLHAGYAAHLFQEVMKCCAS